MSRRGKVRNIVIEWECAVPGVRWDAVNFYGNYVFNTDGGWCLCGNGLEISVGENFVSALAEAGRILLSC